VADVLAHHHHRGVALQLLRAQKTRRSGLRQRVPCGGRRPQAPPASGGGWGNKARSAAPPARVGLHASAAPRCAPHPWPGAAPPTSASARWPCTPPATSRPSRASAGRLRQRRQSRHFATPTTKSATSLPRCHEAASRAWRAPRRRVDRRPARRRVRRARTSAERAGAPRAGAAGARRLCCALLRKRAALHGSARGSDMVLIAPSRPHELRRAQTGARAREAGGRRTSAAADVRVSIGEGS
jgi:hypothetical protein